MDACILGFKPSYQKMESKTESKIPERRYSGVFVLLSKAVLSISGIPCIKTKGIRIIADTFLFFVIHL